MKINSVLGGKYFITKAGSKSINYSSLTNNNLAFMGKAVGSDEVSNKAKSFFRELWEKFREWDRIETHDVSDETMEEYLQRIRRDNYL